MRGTAGVVLLVSLVVAAAAILPGPARAAEPTYPDVSSNYGYDDVGDRTGYDYTVRHRATDWQLVGFYVYAPIAPELLTVQRTYFNGVWWAGVAGLDGYGGSVIYWSPASMQAGLTYHQEIAFHLSVAGQVNTVLNYKYKDPNPHDTNWVYDQWGGQHGSPDGEGDETHRFVAVPSVPEPCSLLALAAGCLGALLGRKRR